MNQTQTNTGNQKPVTVNQTDTGNQKPVTVNQTDTGNQTRGTRHREPSEQQQTIYYLLPGSGIAQWLERQTLD